MRRSARWPQRGHPRSRARWCPHQSRCLSVPGRQPAGIASDSPWQGPGSATSCSMDRGITVTSLPMESASTWPLANTSVHTGRWCCCCMDLESSGGHRHQIPELDGAGFSAAAMDLRGYGASDKTPRGYDPRDDRIRCHRGDQESGILQRRGRRPRLGWHGCLGHHRVRAGSGPRPDQRRGATSARLPVAKQSS